MPPAASAFSYPAFFDKKNNEYAKALLQGKPFREIVSDHGKLYLRVVSDSSRRRKFADGSYERTSRQGSGRENRRRPGGNHSLHAMPHPTNRPGRSPRPQRNSGPKTSFSYNANNNKNGVVITRGSGNQRSSEVPVFDFHRRQTSAAHEFHGSGNPFRHAAAGCRLGFGSHR